MRRRLIPVLAVTLLAAASSAAPASAQSLAARVNAAPADATVRFSFESKPGVCGNGENIMVRRAGDDASTIRTRGQSSNIRSGRASGWSMSECEEGPVRMELQRSGGRIVGVNARVGGAPAEAGSAAHAVGGEGLHVELGSVAAAEAVDYLLGAGPAAGAGRSAERMVFAATLAAAESWPALLRLARQRNAAAKPRGAAVFWLAQAAGEKATEGLVYIVGDDSDEIEVRKQAVFALSRIRGDAAIDALIDIARTNGEPEIRKNAMFWLGQSNSPRAIAFFEEVLRG
jgi:hypothetical protein